MLGKGLFTNTTAWICQQRFNLKGIWKTKHEIIPCHAEVYGTLQGMATRYMRVAHHNKAVLYSTYHMRFTTFMQH